MTSAIGRSTVNALSNAAAASAVAGPSGRHATLKKAAEQLEGVFVQQLFKAMRDTVPEQEGIVSGGAGEEIFTGLLDQHLAAETPKHWVGGIGDALYRQLSRGLPPDIPVSAPVAASVSNIDPSAL